MAYQERERQERQYKRSRSNAENAAGQNGTANFKPNYDTDNLSREQEYEIALSDQGYLPDKVQGYDEFKQGGLRYNPSKTYNLRVLDRQRGHRMLGAEVIGDTWTDPRTPAGRSMHAHYTNHLNYAGDAKVNDPKIPTYKPSQRLLYEQLAQQLGEEQIKKNAAATLEKCQRYHEAINLKINDECATLEEKNKYLAKRDKLNTLTNDLLKGVGQATGKEMPEIKEANLANYLRLAVLPAIALIYLNSESLALLGLIATLYFKLHDGMDEVRDVAIDDLLRDTGVGKADKEEPKPSPSKEPKPVPVGKEEKDDDDKPLEWKHSEKIKKVLASKGIQGGLKEANSKGRPDREYWWHAHHPWPEFMGGEKDQPKMGVQSYVHISLVHPMLIKFLKAKGHNVVVNRGPEHPTNAAFIQEMIDNPFFKAEVMDDLMKFHAALNAITNPKIPRNAYSLGIEYTFKHLK